MAPHIMHPSRSGLFFIEMIIFFPFAQCIVHSAILLLAKSILLSSFLYQIVIKWALLYKALFSIVAIIIQRTAMSTITFGFFFFFFFLSIAA